MDSISSHYELIILFIMDPYVYVPSHAINGGEGL